MKPTEKFRKFAGKFVTIAEAHTTVYVPEAGEYDEDDLMMTVESYHPMEALEDGQEVVALCFSGNDKDGEANGFVAVSDESDQAWVYEDGNDEPVDTPATELSLELASE